MFKPRLGFYLTEKTPKEPPITEEHEGWLVVYDIDEFLNLSSDEELYKYVQEIIEHLSLNWEAKDLAMAISLHIGVKEFPKRENVTKKVVAERLAKALNEESELIQKLRNKYDA